VVDRAGVYDWGVADIGDAAPPYVFPVTAEAVSGYCLAARYENLVYTNQPTAREAGLPGIIAPPAMVFAYAPVRLAEVAAARGLELPDGLQGECGRAALAELAIEFQGELVVPGDVITSVTSVSHKFQAESGRFIIFQVAARNQQRLPVAEYSCTLQWPWDYQPGQ
jgi:hypothetical protein